MADKFRGRMVAELLGDAEALGYQLEEIADEIADRLEAQDPTGEEENGRECRECLEALRAAVAGLTGMTYSDETDAAP